MTRPPCTSSTPLEEHSSPDRDGSWKTYLKTLELLGMTSSCRLVPWDWTGTRWSSTMPKVILKTCSTCHGVCGFEVVPSLSLTMRFGAPIEVHFCKGARILLPTITFQTKRNKWIVPGISSMTSGKPRRCFQIVLAAAGATSTMAQSSVIFVNENENENYQKRKNYDFVNEN